MRIFVTGATGFIGSALVQELIGAGHRVLGLARSDEAAAALSAAGAEAHRGSLTDLQSLRAGAAESDGVIHAGFIHDFSDFVKSCAVDLQAVDTLGAALEGSGRPLVVTSGTALARPGRKATEDDPADSGPGSMPRGASEAATLAWAGRGVRAMVLRLPPSVHGDGDHGFVPALIEVARTRGISGCPDNGTNVWPAVHRLDAVRLYRAVIERGIAGARYHGVAEEGVPAREIAATIGRRLGIPAVSVPAAQVGEHFGWIGHFFSLDNPTSSAGTRESTGWKPGRATLLEDLEGGRYFG